MPSPASTEGKLHFPDTGSVYQDVSLQMNQFLGILHTRRGRIVAALLGAGQSDPELLEAFRERFLRPRRQEAYKTLRRGIERGELPANLDLDLVLDILYGAIYMRFLIRHDELSESYVRAGLPVWCWAARRAIRASQVVTVRLSFAGTPCVDTLLSPSVRFVHRCSTSFLRCRMSRVEVRRNSNPSQCARCRAGFLVTGRGDARFRRPCGSQTLSQRHQDAGCARHGRPWRWDQGTDQGLEISRSTATSPWDYDPQARMDICSRSR